MSLYRWFIVEIAKIKTYYYRKTGITNYNGSLV